MGNIYHDPVMLAETIKLLNPGKNENFIDCTLGGGGHAQKILEKTGPEGKLLGIDVDEDAINESRRRLKKYKERIFFANRNFKDLKQIIHDNRFNNVSGILLDLGVSYHQLISPERGFSYKYEGRLDMRLGKEENNDAESLINEISKEDLAWILKSYGEVNNNRRFAEIIVKSRKEKYIKTTADLKEIIIKSGLINRRQENKVLSQIFQAIRIAINNELENLQNVLEQAIEALNKNGRLAVISYHSLEDRITKKFFQQESRNCICPDEAVKCTCSHKKSLKIITKKPVTPTSSEIRKNKKSRSAKLRVVNKI